MQTFYTIILEIKTIYASLHDIQRFSVDSLFPMCLHFHCICYCFFLFTSSASCISVARKLAYVPTALRKTGINSVVCYCALSVRLSVHL